MGLGLAFLGGVGFLSWRSEADQPTPEDAAAIINRALTELAKIASDFDSIRTLPASEAMSIVLHNRSPRTLDARVRVDYFVGTGVGRGTEKPTTSETPAKDWIKLKPNIPTTVDLRTYPQAAMNEVPTALLSLPAGTTVRQVINLIPMHRRASGEGYERIQVEKRFERTLVKADGPTFDPVINLP
jgi:hypothetical protein